MKKKLKIKDRELRELDNINASLEDTIEISCRESVESKCDGKQYDSVTRLMVYDAITNQVPTENIPTLMAKFSKRLGTPLTSVPHRTTVEQMVRELGVISELQTAEAILDNSNVTVGFDATTQEGTHINSIHITTPTSCYAVAVDELAGGTAQDYSHHIVNSFDNLAKTYSLFHPESSYEESRSNIIHNVSTALSDRCPANHAAIVIVNERWQKNLTELYCHLHPLDSFASSCRTALKAHESTPGKIFGHECYGSKIILLMNKLRYKDGKGDPRAFITFLEDNHLPRGLIPRYRGNRLHIMYKIAAIYFQRHNLFLTFLRAGNTCGGMKPSVAHYFNTDIGKTELQVLGLIGLFLTSPWLKTFYTSAENQLHHLDGIDVVRRVLARIKDQLKDVDSMLTSDVDFFDNKMEVNAEPLHCLQITAPADSDLFSTMMVSCLTAIVAVIERQYEKNFAIEVTKELRQTTTSSRAHNIDSEEIMGMFSALKAKAPNATISRLSCKMRSRKNSADEYLDSMDDDVRDAIIKKAISVAKVQRKTKRTHQKDLMKELSRRHAEKRRAREETERRKLERSLKTKSCAEVMDMFPDMSEKKREAVQDLMEDRVTGRDILHVWLENDLQMKYFGRVERRNKRSGKYVVAYWAENESYDDAVDYNMSKEELLVDLINDDLIL